MLKKFTLLIFFLALSKTSAQITIKVIDSQTGKGLAQATLQINNTQTSTDPDGIAILPKSLEFDNTVITASYLGYQQVALTLMQLRQNQLTIKLEPVAYELQEVAVKNISHNADTIMKYVKRNMASNYKSTLNTTKSTVFFRKSTIYKPIQASAEMSKSTKVSKKDLQKVNADLKMFTDKLIKHPPQEAADILADYYTTIQTIDGKR